MSRPIPARPHELPLSLRLRRCLCAAASIAVIASCDRAGNERTSAAAAASNVSGTGWVLVHEATDPEHPASTVRVSLDTVGLRQRADDRVHFAWFETRHSVPRREGGRPFDRELIRVMLRCEPAGEPRDFRTVDALLLDGDRPPVYQEGASVAELDRRGTWRPVRPGTADAAAFRAVCVRAARGAVRVAGQ
jgi:hypothetical protein